MINTTNDKPVPDFKQESFTTGTGKTDMTLNYSYDWSKSFNFGCMYLLPCGLCMKTDRPCPKYQGDTWKPFVVWNNTITSNPQQNTINTNFTTGDNKND